MEAEQWHGITKHRPGHPIHVWCPSVFTAKFAPNCPTGSWTNRIYLVTHLFASKMPTSQSCSFQMEFGVFSLIISRCPGSFWSGPEFLFCSKTFLHSPKEGSSGSSRQQNSWNVELINFLPSSNSRPRYLIYEYRWRVSAGICQNTHLTLRR